MSGRERSETELSIEQRAGDLGIIFFGSEYSPTEEETETLKSILNSTSHEAEFNFLPDRLDVLLQFKKGKLETRVSAARVRGTDELRVVTTLLYLGKPMISDTTAYDDCKIEILPPVGSQEWGMIFTGDSFRHGSTNFIVINSKGDVKKMNF